MRVLLIGQGGREHALAGALCRSGQIDELVCAPGSAAISRLPRTRCLDAAMEVEQLSRLAIELRPDLTVVGPEQPLVDGLADRLQEKGLLTLGPGSAGARLEGSKVFAKEFMKKHGLPTAEFAVFDDGEKALRHVRARGRCVVKADGLAAGKGVYPCTDSREAEQAVEHIMLQKKYGSAGARIVVEDFLEGEEVSFIALLDGRSLVPLASSQDHKRLLDGDGGPNTGGMGAYSPAPALDDEMRQRVEREILQPLLAGLRRDGIEYRGVIYAGLMLTRQGPMVLEFNVRLGDPETQPLLLRLRSDLLQALVATARGELENLHLEWDAQPAVCVVMASAGYPGEYRKGLPITGLEQAEALPGVTVFHAGTRLQDGRFVTAGGRVLNVCALGRDLPGAVAQAYRAVALIDFEGAHFRKDIAQRALARRPRT